MAPLDFQDSIEILYWSVLKKLDAQVKDNTIFTSFFDMVEKAHKNTESKKLPFEAKISELKIKQEQRSRIRLG